jgi:hypothetical protein
MPILLAGAITLFQTDAGGSDRFAVAGTTAEEARAFLLDLQAALESEDAPALAAMASYPMRLNLAEGSTTVESSQEFLILLDAIFPPEARGVILSQDADSLFANYQGVMIGRGEVWFAPVGEGGEEALRIIAVNRIYHLQNR